MGNQLPLAAKGKEVTYEKAGEVVANRRNIPMPKGRLRKFLTGTRHVGATFGNLVKIYSHNYLWRVGEKENVAGMRTLSSIIRSLSTAARNRTSSSLIFKMCGSKQHVK